MTAKADAGRARAAIRLGVAAAIAAALAILAVTLDVASRRVAALEGPVAPEWSERFPEARALRIGSAAETLTLERGADGWTLAERGGYPVSPAALTELHRAMSALEFAGARTRDPANQERLGVTDPAEGGSGVRLTLLDAQDAPLVDLIIGDARAGGVFVRRPGEDQTFAVDGAVPDIAAPGFWLDLDILPIALEDIREVAITPGGGGSPYRLMRDSPTASDFTLGEPSTGWTLITAGAANGPGGAAAGLRFTDVAPADAVDPAVTAQHTVRTFDGLSVSLSLLGSGAERWVRVRAEADPGGPEEEAEALNARTEGWVYKLPQYAPERLARQLDRIARVAVIEQENGPDE